MRNLNFSALKSSLFFMVIEFCKLNWKSCLIDLILWAKHEIVKMFGEKRDPFERLWNIIDLKLYVC